MSSRSHIVGVIALGALAAAITIRPAGGAPLPVGAVVETDPVPHSGDAADDPAIWVHPTDRSQSLVIGTDKQGGLGVYDLSGKQVQYLPDGRLNNVDLRYGFTLGGKSIDLVAVSDRSHHAVALYEVNPDTRRLESLGTRAVAGGLGEPYGLCMYHDPQAGQFYAFTCYKSGKVQQYRLFDQGGQVEMTLVRTLAVGSATEGLVADDELGWLYVAEEGKGIWKYSASPAGGTQRTLVDSTGTGHLKADVEGLALYFAAGATGYLIASSQGDNTFAVYQRQGNNPYLFNFRITDSGKIDGASDTDGIEVISTGLGTTFSSGLFVAQDGSNAGGKQDFKFVRWEDIAGASSPNLTIYSTFDPRGAFSPPGPATKPAAGDADGDGRIDYADYAVLTASFGSTGVLPWYLGGWVAGNFNDDDRVDGADYTIWADNYTGAVGTPVPGPVVLWLCLPAAPALARRRPCQAAACRR